MNPAIKTKVKHALDAGHEIPDDILIRVIDQRLSQSDCRVNGWVLDGFPQNPDQVNMLTALNVKPSLVCILEQTIDDSVNRLGKRRMDPITG